MNSEITCLIPLKSRTDRSPSPGGAGKILTRQQNFSRDGSIRASIRSDCSASSSRIHSSVAGTLQQPLNGTEEDDDSGVARGSDGVRSGFNSEWSEDGATDPESSTLPPPSYRSHASSVTIRRDSDMVRTLKYTTADYAATGPAERTFRVVLAGDASVGKTALIMRLVKGTFVSDLPATLGVDFHVIALRVDGKNLALQLWDTAGQERFRSMCKSYFRRADGAFLVYDCTSERSFLNVRNWMETIQECVQRKIPILLCGNKVDLRIAYAADGKRCIAEQDGQKLAKISDTLFFEVSAKDGSNVLEATVSLARDLLANEDCEVQDSSLLLNQTPAAASATGGRCGSVNRCSR